MHKKRLTRFLNDTETRLRFYVLYLSYSDDRKEHSDFRDLALLNYQELQHRFIEGISSDLMINIAALDKGDLPTTQEQKLDELLNKLHDESVDYLITSEFTSWLKGDREKYFFHSMLKMMVITKVNLVASPDDVKIIGDRLWPRLKDKQHLDEIEERKKEAKRRALNRLHNQKIVLSELSSEAEKIFKQDEERRNTAEQREFNRISRDPTLQAIELVCRLCPTIDKQSDIIIINYLTYLCISRELALTTVQELLLRIRSMYIQACENVSLNWDILKTENERLINKTYDRLQSQYKISNLLFPTSDTKIRKRCTITTLDLLFITSTNFSHRLKLLTDKFSSDKANSEDFQIALNEKQWEMLVELAKGDTKPKINRALNKLLKDAYKIRFNKRT
ncbi:conserved hypothetical protein [Vibrio crassostreae]|nr:conserved hypothetical protein [Vibrio crassostreae]